MSELTNEPPNPPAPFPLLRNWFKTLPHATVNEAAFTLAFNANGEPILVPVSTAK